MPRLQRSTYAKQGREGGKFEIRSQYKCKKNVKRIEISWEYCPKDSVGYF
jgi:hypothetical protein